MVQQEEKKILNQYLAKTYPDWLTWRNVRVGPFPPATIAEQVRAGTEQYTKQFRRFVDAIVSNGSVVRLIEVKLRPDPEGIAELMLYKKLFPDTPEFTTYKTLPIELELIATIGDPAVAALALEQGVFFVVFQPV